MASCTVVLLDVLSMAARDGTCHVMHVCCGQIIYVCMSGLLLHMPVDDIAHQQFRPVLADVVASTLAMTVCSKLARRPRYYVM
jgi:hypothetical protein